eukprot:6099326-Prymnesium_polylepis.1
MSPSSLTHGLLLALAAPAARALVSGGRRIHVSAWQGAAVSADVPANLARVTSEVAAANAAGVELLCFPEMFLHGYDATQEQLQQCALTQDAPELRAVGEAAKAEGVAVGVPYCERCPIDASRLYNSMAVFDAAGELVCNYRKVNLWGEWEASVFERGTPDQLTTFDLRLASGVEVKCGCLICFDIEFPEPARTLAVQGAEVRAAPFEPAQCVFSRASGRRSPTTRIITTQSPSSRSFRSRAIVRRSCYSSRRRSARATSR